MKRFIIISLLTIINVSAFGCAIPGTHNYYLFSAVGQQDFRHQTQVQCNENWQAYTGSTNYYVDLDEAKAVAEKKGDRMMADYITQLKRYLDVANQTQDQWDYPTKRELTRRSQILKSVQAFALSKTKTRLRSQHALLYMRCTMMLGQHQTNVTFWEQTAQWQSVQAYPNLMISQSIGLWQHNHNYAFTHEWQRYQSYWLHYYWTDKHGIDAVGRVWRGGTVSGEDPCQVYMRVFGVSAHDFYKEIYDYASHMATYDLDAIRTYGASSIGKYTYSYVDAGPNKIQVAYSSCPQSTGFNVIPLEVPSAGTTIKTIFSALPAGRTNLLEGDKKQYHNGNTFTTANVTKYNSFTGAANRGFRHGYVALLSDGTRVYHSVDTVYSVARTTSERYRAMNDTTTFVVPEGTQRLFFIVSPAPTQYIVHSWDENITNDDQWPYQLEFENTDIVGHMPTVDLSDTSILPHDTLLNIYVGFNPTTGNNYSGTTYTLSSCELRAIGEALRIQPANIASLLRTYSTSQANNTVQLVGLNATSGNTVVNGPSTANGYGHWFNASGNVCSYGNASYVYSELNTATLAFNVGQYPGRCRNGQVYQLGQAFRYKEGRCGKTHIPHLYWRSAHRHRGGKRPREKQGYQLSVRPHRQALLWQQPPLSRHLRHRWPQSINKII